MRDRLKFTNTWVTSESPDIVAKVREAQIRQLYGQTYLAIAGSLVAAFTVGSVLWQEVPRSPLLWWLAFILATTLLRIVSTIIFYRLAPGGEKISFWAHLHACISLTFAIAWGVPFFILWPASSTLHQMVLPICVMAIGASTMAIYHTWVPSFIGFLLISLGCFSLRFLIEGTVVHTVVGCAGIFCILILVRAGSMMNAKTRNALITGLKNEKLAQTLIEDKKKIDALNSQLTIENRVRLKAEKAAIATQRKIELANKDLEQALADIKQLSGMLPICASCKKIRDDDGYWSKLENYFEHHSDLLFSHSLCPDCAEAMYGNQKWFDRSKMPKK